MILSNEVYQSFMTSGLSDVYFGSVMHGNTGKFASFAVKVDKIIEQLDFSTIEKKDKVAIKMHLGFGDGYQTVPVFFVRRIVQAVKKAGGFPFITDNPTAVYNAVNRGYTSETCGCPLIPVSGVKDGYVGDLDVKFHNVDGITIAGVMRDADVLVDLTHAKGHNSCGFGGAIKNIALGGFAAKTRWHKIHGVEQSFPYWDSEKCTPEHAKELVESCPEEVVKYDEEKHKLTVMFGMCNQCMKCVEADKDVGCLEIKQENFSLFQELMAVAADEVLKTFDENKRFFLNFALDITPACDCWGMGMPNVVNDVGLIASRDIVAVEMATLDLIAKEGLIESMVPPYYRNLSSDMELHPFSRLHGKFKNPYLVTEYAEKLDMGSSKYNLIEILSPEETLSMKAPTSVSESEPTFF